MEQFGRLDETPSIWKKLLNRAPDNHNSWFGYAELCLYLDRDEDYRWACTEMLKRFGDTTVPILAERVARACFLRPTEGAEFERALALVDRAIATDPAGPDYPYFQLAKGLAELRRGHYESAIDFCSQAESRNIFSPICRCIIAIAEQELGRSTEAQETLARDRDYLPLFEGDMNAWIYAVLCREANQRVIPHFKEFLDSKYSPTQNVERLSLVAPCYLERRYRKAADLSAAMFTDDASLLDNFSTTYNAGCVAVLAGLGKGYDAPANEAERARFRMLGLTWLRRNLDGQAKRPEAQIARMRDDLLNWRTDADLAGVRGDAIDKLPEAERADWRKFWADHADLLKKAESP
jgi:serine/threonine-protein kinase